MVNCIIKNRQLNFFFYYLVNKDHQIVLMFQDRLKTILIYLFLKFLIFDLDFHFQKYYSQLFWKNSKIFIIIQSFKK